MDIEFIKASLSDIDEVEDLYNDLCDFLVTKDYNPGFRKINAKGLVQKYLVSLNNVQRKKALKRYGFMFMMEIM